MLTLPPKFKQALGSGVRTSLYPIVRIYKGIQIDDEIPEEASINLSIKETSIKNLGDTYEGYDPLLLNTPSIKSSADIINNKYTISSVSLSISNTPYNGKIFSDDVPSLLNAVVQVYYASNGLDALEDCLLVYTGTIRRYSQSAETVKLTLEDLTEQKLTTKVPATLIPDHPDYQTDDINKPYPMVYGYVDKSPLIQTLENSLLIDKPSREIKGWWTGESIINFGNPAIKTGHPLVDNGYLKLNSHLAVYEGGFIPIYQEGTTNWGSRVHTNLLDATIYHIEDATTEDSARVILNHNTFVYEGIQDDGEGNLIGVGKQGIPARIYRPITKVSFAALNNFNATPESENRFIGYSNDDGSMQSIVEDVDTYPNFDSPAQDLYNAFWDPVPDEGSVLKFWEPSVLNSAYTESIEDEIFDYSDKHWDEFYDSYGASLFPVSWIQNNNYDENGNNLSGLHISAQNAGNDDSRRTGSFARLHLEDNVGNLPCRTKIFYDISYFLIGQLADWAQSPPSRFWIEKELKVGWTWNSHTLETWWEQLPNYPWDNDLEGDDWITYCHVPNASHSFVEGETAVDLGIDQEPTDEQGVPLFADYARIDNDGGIMNDGVNTGYSNIINNFDTTSASDTIQWGSPWFEESAVCSVIANLKEVYILQDVLITDYNTKSFYADIAGRSLPATEDSHIVFYITNVEQGNEYIYSVLSTETEHGLVAGDLFHFYDTNDDYVGEFTCIDSLLPNTLMASIGLGHGSSGRIGLERSTLISSANGIMKDILQDELLYDGNINEEQTDIQNEWQYSFTLNEQKEAKQIFEGLFKSSLLIPSFDSAGQFKFIGIKQLINLNDVISINTEDVIKYSFSLTKLDDIYNSVNVKYKKSYGSGEFDVQTGYEIGDSVYTTYDELTTDGLGYDENQTYDVGYYGLSAEDAKLEVESEYIRDEYTAHRLQKRLLMWYCNQHLVTKIDLPAHYMHLEAGDYIKFNELMGGKLAFGYDYSRAEHRNGQLIYPAFFITKVSKSLTKVSIEGVQVHRGEFGFSGTDPDAEDDENIVDGDGNDVTEDWGLGDPSDDPNYDDDSINTDEYTLELDPYISLTLSSGGTLNDGQVVFFVTTNTEDSWEYNIWAKNISDRFLYDGDWYEEGEGIPNGEVDASNLVNHTLTMQGNNGVIQIEKKMELYPENTFVEFTLEVKNTEHQDEGYFTQFGIEYTDPVLGDVNGDYILNILDVVTTMQHILAETSDEIIDLADMNQDGSVNVIDVVLMINIITGN